jgi:deoxyribodipyrimidine photo-lyase
MNDSHTDERHWRFIQQSLSDIEKILAKQNKQLSIAYGEADQIFSEIINQYEITKVFSHEETGLKLTYERDKKLKKFFNAKKIQWHEYQTNAVIRGLNNRKTWEKQWDKVMRDEIKPINLAKANIVFHRFPNSAIPKFRNDLIINEVAAFQHEKKCVIFLKLGVKTTSSLFLNPIKAEQAVVDCPPILPMEI